MPAYYNEWEPYPAQWLRNLIGAGLIAPGDVDERSIKDVRGDDLKGYTQCHFFAGIGGWSYALRLAMWPDDRPVWTGSCPCQPFSAAGKKQGESDDRHLWPDFYRLIAECQPSIAFGEQVASKDGLGWLDRVRTDLESSSYAFGAADLCAASIGAPHSRQRLFWVADAESSRYGEYERNSGSMGISGKDDEGQESESWGSSPSIGNSGQNGSQGMGIANGARSLKRQQTSPFSRHWSSAVPTSCSDGKWRRVEPSILPLADGLPNRVGLLRGAGNAIVPQVAQAFIEAFMDARP